MYGNNFGIPFNMQNIPYNPMLRGTQIFNNPPIMNTRRMINPTRSGGLSSLLGLGGQRGITSPSILGGKNFNFTNILNNTSKALGVVKEAIPIVKEVGPMIGNMKSMLRIASAFKDITDPNETTSEVKQTSTNNITPNIEKENDTKTISTTNTISEPNFFI